MGLKIITAEERMAEKKGHKIVELPYIHPVDIAGNSKSFPNIYTFMRLGVFYILRLLRTLFKRK